MPWKNPETRRIARRAWYKRTRGARLAQHKDWRTKNGPQLKVIVRQAKLNYKFGLSVSKYESMLAGQGGVCAICKQPPNGKRLAVDHDHITGRIRGLLCQLCNTALGSFKDNIDRLKSAISYLETS